MRQGIPSHKYRILFKDISVLLPLSPNRSPADLSGFHQPGRDRGLTSLDGCCRVWLIARKTWCNLILIQDGKHPVLCWVVGLKWTTFGWLSCEEIKKKGSERDKCLIESWILPSNSGGKLNGVGFVFSRSWLASSKQVSHAALARCGGS